MVSQQCDEQVGLAGDQVLEGVAGVVGGERGAGLVGVVADEDERAAVRAPVLDQRGDVLLAARVVARAPGRVVEGLLDVDDDEGGLGAHRETVLGAPPVASPDVARRLAP